MIAPHTSISPRSEHGRRLAGSIVPPRVLTLDDRRQMYALLRTYFRGTDRARFDEDLREKDTVIVLRDRESGRIGGFSTLMRLDAPVDDRAVIAFFSGDTIIDREYWGETLLSRLWARAVFAEADRITSDNPGVPLYWFLICSGYKTWRFLPLFFREFYPNPDASTPPEVQRVLDALGTRKFGPEYLPERGIVRFRAPTPLRDGVAAVTDERLRDRHIAFFTRANPGHAAGDELACLAGLSHANLTRAARRMMAEPL